LLPFRLKALEKVVAKQVTANVEEDIVQARYQSHYGLYHSTETAVGMIANDILTSSESVKVTAVVLVDVLVVFHIVNHKILLLSSSN